MLDQIQMERDGDIIEKSMIKSCTQMLEGMYMTKIETDDQRLYNMCFEPKFMEASKKFYARESERMLRECDAGTYCRLAKKRLVEEEDRCRTTLSEATRTKIEAVVCEELISNKLKDLIDMESGVIYMINNDRLEDLKLIYELNEKVDGEEKRELRTALQERISYSGKEINQSALGVSSAEGTASNQNQQTASAIKWVEEILILKDKYDRIVEKAFNNDQKLQTAQTQSFSGFVNASTFNRASEYVSLFIDDNMKKGIKDKSEEEIDVILNKAIDLLKYIADKDLFERYYKKHLSRRLLLNKSQSIDVEKQLVSKMKFELGNTFTSKMEVMFKDMTLSDELTGNFKSVLDTIRSDDPSKKSVELGVHILTSMTWPQELVTSALDPDSSKDKVIFPPQIDRLITNFTLFYATKYNGRRLTWLPTMGTADIKVRFPRPNGKEQVHELNVSTYAMIILWQFAELPASESLTCSEIQAATNIPMPDLMRNLQSLALNAKTRILKKEPMSRDVKPEDKFSFNEGFKSSFVRIKVGVVASSNRVENERERIKTEKKNDETRHFVCEAAIVRIMKYVLPPHCHHNY
jgi:cullin 3